MNLIDRVKNILVTPKTEWMVIDAETATPQSLLTGYVLPLTIIYSLGSLLAGLFWAGGLGLQYFLVLTVIKFVSAMISFYISAYVIDMLAPSFSSEKNINKSAQLVAYSNTPMWIIGLLSFIPGILWLLMLAAAVYAIYLMYLGIGPLKKTPEDKKVVYMIVGFIVIAVIASIVMYLLGMIIFKILGYGTFGWGFGWY